MNGKMIEQQIKTLWDSSLKEFQTELKRLLEESYKEGYKEGFDSGYFNGKEDYIAGCYGKPSVKPYFNEE